MLGFGGNVRLAQDALRAGRLEDAQRLLEQPGVAGQRGAVEALAQLARALVDRGERRLRQDDAEGAWQDLLAAERLRTAERAGERLRFALVRLGVSEVRALLTAGDPHRAGEVVEHLRRRGARSPELQVLEETARLWQRARDLADQGEFAAAQDAAERAVRLFIDLAPLAVFRADLMKRREAFAGLSGRLHEAADANRWREVIDLADELLEVAPQHAEARRLRGRAWRAVEPNTVPMRHDDAPPPPEEQGSRFVLWVDGVAGYLICLGDRLTLGQAVLDARADVPLVADVSRLHATLTRDAEGYLFETSRGARVNGQPTARALLRSGDRLTLGASCQLLFRQPVPVSTSARLDVVSGHRLPLAVDGVLLMADNLVLGPGEQVHVTVPDLTKPVVLFRLRDGLGLKYAGKVTVNGQVAPERGPLPLPAVVCGDEVSFAVEPLGARL